MHRLHLTNKLNGTSSLPFNDLLKESISVVSLRLRVRGSGLRLVGLVELGLRLELVLRVRLVLVLGVGLVGGLLETGRFGWWILLVLWVLNIVASVGEVWVVTVVGVEFVVALATNVVHFFAPF